VGPLANAALHVGRLRGAAPTRDRSLDPFHRARIREDGTPAEPNTLRQRRGREIFEAAKCTLCHPAPAFARGWQVDIGTGAEYDVPTLRGLTARGSEPYGHDGRWATLEEAVRAVLEAREVELSDREFEYLIEYLKLL
jgi:cytochrome c peroxidase